MRLVWTVGLLLFLSTAVCAQDTPRVEIFGGFSYASIKIDESRINTTGLHAMLAVNSSHGWLEFVADFSGHYGTQHGASARTHILMAGMRSTLRRGRVTTFVHSMYGASFERADVRLRLEGIDGRQRVWFTFVPGGGGLDIVLNKRIALRVFQFDLLFSSRSADYEQASAQTEYSKMQPRLSCGLVLRFGKV